VSDDVIERAALEIRAAVGEGGSGWAERAAEAAARVLLDWLAGFHGIPLSELAQAKRELRLTDTASPAPEAPQAPEAAPPTDTGRE